MPNNSIRDHILKFFDFSEPSDGDNFSPLNILKRHKDFCLSGGKVAVWPGVMTVLSGIDMLGYFLNAGNIIGTSSGRFKNFYNTFFPKGVVNSGNDRILWLARCSMMHLFGLYTEEKGKPIGFVYTWDDSSGDFITVLASGNKYEINFFELNRLFDTSVDNYKKELLCKLINDPTNNIISNFETVYNKFGLIHDPNYPATTLGSTISGSAIKIP